MTAKKQVGIDSRKQVGSSRFYNIFPDDPYESITTIDSIVNKPFIAPWMAKEERLLSVRVAANMAMEELNLNGMNVASYSQELINRIGREKAGNKIKEAAAEIGTEAHGMIEWKIRRYLGFEIGPEPKISDDAAWAVMAYDDWAKEHNFKPVMSERVVWSVKHHFAGTVDIVGYVDDILKVVDIKTGKAIYDEARLQVSAYFMAILEMGLAEPQGAIILRLPKIQTDPKFEAKEVTDLVGHFEAFLAAQKLWNWQYKQEQEYRNKTSKS
jgi:hypothetical protein